MDIKSIDERTTEIVDDVFHKLPDEVENETAQDTVNAYASAVWKIAKRLAIAEHIIRKADMHPEYAAMLTLADE